MNFWKAVNISGCVAVFLFLLTPLSAEINTFELAEDISNSLNNINDRRFKTVAFSYISGKGQNEKTLNQLIDYTNVSIVRSKRFKVIDRTKLRTIIKEQINNTSPLISPAEYRQLGKVLGVDLFLYGTIYENEMIVKAIDVETSAIVWADVFALDKINPKKREYPYYEISGATVNSIRKNMEALQKSGIKKISFWTFTGILNNKKLIDYMSLAIASENNLQIVDRENLNIILEEQKLTMDSIIDENQAKKIGALYGIDAFIYGNVIKQDDRYIASLKLMNIISGVIEWADLLFLDILPPSNVPQKTALVKNKKEMKNNTMILIPEGIAIIGSSDPESTAFPVSQKRINAFKIDKYEVTNKEYAAFIAIYNYRVPKNWQNRRPPPNEAQLPVVYVTWEDAVRFCEVNNKRLPTEFEWEYAYRGLAGNEYPWGKKIGNYRIDWSNHSENEKYSSVPVNKVGRDISVFGVRGMAGNVREWTADDYEPYAGNTVEDPNYAVNKTIRGGSWAKSIQSSLGWKRDSSNSVLAWPDVGFRCAADIKN